MRSQKTITEKKQRKNIIPPMPKACPIVYLLSRNSKYLTGKELFDSFMFPLKKEYQLEVHNLANNNSAAKRNRQNERRRMQNKMIKSRVRSGIKGYLEAIETRDSGSAEEKLKSTLSLLDSATRKGIYHRNTAARTKSRLQKKLNTLTVE